MTERSVAIATLDRLARSWRRRRAAGVAVLSLAGMLLMGAVARWVGVSPVVWSALAVAAGLLVAISAVLLVRHRVDARAAARHLDRTCPTLEESGELLLVPVEELTPLERLQRVRVEAAFERLHPLAPLPNRWFRGALVAAAVWGISGAALALLPHTPSRPADTAVSAAPSRRAGPPAARDVAVTVTPPSYVGRSAARSASWDVDAPEGSRVTWAVRLDGRASAARLVTSAGDTIALTALPGDAARYEGTTTAERSALYQLALDDAAGRRTLSDFHRFTVQRDGPPTATVVRPAPRTVLAPDDVPRVPIQVLAADDHGIATARIVATVTSGRGEAVKFRERTLALDRIVPRPAAGGGRAATLYGMLDLRALELAPGDELYFHVAVRDNRAPTPHEGRSETVFLAITDTADAPPATLAGLAVSLPPEYFRSQRQIIIDTEKLLADRPGLGTPEFRDRSNSLGTDQGLLRLRYGELVGDEAEDVPIDADDAEDLRHDHDTEENATLLASGVKATLKLALEQMWQAERYLRTYQPRAALPFEYRALEYLKAVQQSARVYVQRVGFEPPPLEPDRKRLSGKLDGIAGRTTHAEVAAASTLPAVRTALARVRAVRAGEAPSGSDVAAVETAGRELAPAAVERPGQLLETLRLLRRLADAWRAGTRCDECLGPAEAGLWRALPAAEVRPGGADGPASEVARRYFDRLRAAP